jgi:hypothetical protein
MEAIVYIGKPTLGLYWEYLIIASRRDRPLTRSENRLQNTNNCAVPASVPVQEMEFLAGWGICDEQG